MNRKTLAIFLSLAMILSLLAANGLAFAEDAHPEAPAEEPQVVEVEEKTEEVPEVTEPEEKAEEVPEVTEPEEEVEEEPVETVTEPEATEDETEKVEEEVTEELEEKVEEPEVPEDPKEEVETPAEEPENPEEGEEPAGEEQPGEEPVDPEEPVVDVPVAPVNPEEVELDPEAPVTNPEVNDVVGGGNAGVEGLPVVPEVPQQPVCSCGVNEGEAHEEGCPMYEAPAQPAPVVPAVPVEGCTCGTLSEDPQDHDVDCPVFLATINRLPAQVKHSELYLKIMACETFGEAVGFVTSASDEDWEDVTETEEIEIFEYIDTLLQIDQLDIISVDTNAAEIIENSVIINICTDQEIVYAAPFGAPVVGK